MAKISENEQVCVLHTGETGIVRRFLDRYHAVVDINGEFRSYHISALEPAWLLSPDQKSPIYPEKSKEVPPVGNGIAGLPGGIHLLFIPVRNLAGDIIRYQVSLANRTRFTLHVHYTFLRDQSIHTTLRKQIGRGDDLAVHEFQPDQLNEQPCFKIEGWLAEKNGNKENSFIKEWRLKPKQFFGDTYKWGQEGGVLLTLLEDIPEKKVPLLEPKTKESFDWEQNKKPRRHEVLEKAEMPDFIDLHIEKLDPDWMLLNKNELLEVQVTHARQYLESAIRHRLHTVYLVHGIGKGVLKEAIANLLDEYPSVTSYSNSYNPRFGFGATEVILK